MRTNYHYPPDSNAHPWFPRQQTNKLRLAPNGPIPGQRLPTAPPPKPPLRVSDITDEWEYEVDEILDSRLSILGSWPMEISQIPWYTFCCEEAGWQQANKFDLIATAC